MSKSKYDSVAKEYEKIRPEYPNELIDKLISSTNITIDSNLLEIGAGTGKATIPLAKKGYKIDCIEIEQNMANILIDKIEGLSNVFVLVDNFETWENIKGKNYDLIFSAQAFHWIDNEIKYKKCNELLKENGKLALFWYFSMVESEVFDKLNYIFDKYNSGFACTGIDDCHRFFERERGNLQGNKYFNNIKEYIFESEPNIQDAQLFVKRYNTTSSYASLSEDDKVMINKELAETINENGGKVVSKLMYGLYIVDKIEIKER